MHRSIAFITDPPQAEPGIDTAIARALLDRVSEGLHPEAFRLHVPGRVLAFGSRDAINPAFDEAVAAAENAGFRPEQRLAGGKAAVFHESTLAFSWAIPDARPRETINERFELIGEILIEALASLGVEAQMGEVPGEYCPGSSSINVEGRRKLVGAGQRLVPVAAHLGGVIVVDDAALVNEALTPIYETLGYEWDPNATGAIAEEAPVSVDVVYQAVIAALGRRFERVPTALDAATQSLAATIAPTIGPRRR